MEVNTYIVADENSTAEPSESWCEAEDFIFVRRYGGHKIFSDRCKVMVRNNRILRFFPDLSSPATNRNNFSAKNKFLLPGKRASIQFDV